MTFFYIHNRSDKLLEFMNVAGHFVATFNKIFIESNNKTKLMLYLKTLNIIKETLTKFFFEAKFLGDLPDSFDIMTCVR